MLQDVLVFTANAGNQLSEMNVRRNVVKIQARSISMENLILFFFILIAALVLTSCSSGREGFNKMMEERNRILQTSLPEGMTFEDVPLSTILEEISKASGLTIKPWKDEGDRKVTIDVSGMMVNAAIKVLVLCVDGEGAVLIEQKYFLHHSWGQYWPWGYPPKVIR
jgi:hypothetical protein